MEEFRKSEYYATCANNARKTAKNTTDCTKGFCQRRIAEAERKPTDLVNPLIKHKVVSVEEKIEQICALLEEHEEASLFFLLKDSDSRSELVARFMGILELIKLHRITITTVHFIEDVAEYDECGLEMKFKLNPDYVPTDSTESEFDAVHENNDETEKDDNNE
jgi:hypothetical protein